MDEKNIKKIICFGLLIFFATLLGVIYFISNKKNEISDNDRDSISTNYIYSDIYDINEYQTVYNLMKKYLDNLNNSSYILDLILNSYKNKNNINATNYQNYIEEYYESYSYEIEKMKLYYNSYFKIFLIDGKYSLESYDSVLKTTNIKDIVIFDIANNSFSIIPMIPDNDFKSIILKYDLENYTESIIRNNNNEIEFKELEESNEVLIYLNKYINLMINDCSTAYNKLQSDSNNRKMNYNEFNLLCDNFKTGKYSTVIKKYNTQSLNNGTKIFEVEDYNSLKYKFIINSVMNYDVTMTK